MGKRYYWLKLPDDFFRQKPIKKLRRIAGGDTYTIIYLKMLLVSLKNEGKLFFDGVEENFTEEIALELDEEEENVKVTVQFLMAQGLLQLIDESEYELTECSRMVGSESASAERMRRLRDIKYGFVKMEREYCCCPKCRNILNAGPNYQPEFCDRCGQALDFSNTEWEEDKRLGFLKPEAV